MKVTCSTCLELLTPSDVLSSAPCGHIFHSCCILQWLETGKSSCPQCRSKCYEKQLRRVYFTEAANITLDTQSNVNTLQDRLDSLTFQLRCSENNLKTANEGKERNYSWREVKKTCPCCLILSQLPIWFSSIQKRSLSKSFQQLLHY